MLNWFILKLRLRQLAKANYLGKSVCSLLLKGLFRAKLEQYLTDKQVTRVYDLSYLGRIIKILTFKEVKLNRLT